MQHARHDHHVPSPPRVLIWSPPQHTDKFIAVLGKTRTFVSISERQRSLAVHPIALTPRKANLSLYLFRRGAPAVSVPRCDL
ncbi:hypothetical protein E2C01_095646 [Portunus trituberculatus]|uniref:Uncharacterized protein n=1 Tax=Portunus trituberculatus TaxID=210409 RepID=A0A5B7K4J7_PORTR|nr:hypothetical protein [Portunus trituberculatus]